MGHSGPRWVAPGGALAVVVWMVASAAFGVYVADVGSYNKTDGGIAGVVLLWLWLSNTAILLGQFNAELERRRVLRAGRCEGESHVEPHDTGKLD